MRIASGIWRCAIAALVISAAFGIAACGTDLYVDPAGTGGAYTTIQEAINAAGNDGDTIHIVAGVYIPATTIVVNKNNLTILGPQANVDPRLSQGSTRSAGSAEEAVIDGSAHNLGVVIALDANNVVINGLEVKSGTSDMISSGQHGWNDPHSGITVEYCLIHDGRGDEGVQLKKVADSVLQYNYVFEIADAGDGLNIADDSSYCSISYNEVAGIHGENAAIYIYGSEHMEIIGNVVRDSGIGGNDGIKVGSKGGADAGKTDVLVKDNIIHNITQDGISVYMSGVTIEGNEVHDCTSENGAIYIAWSVHDVTVRYNEVYNNTLETSKWGTPGGITIGEAVSVGSVQIYGNTLAGNSPADVANFAAGAPLLDATANWWGQDTGPLAGQMAGNVAYSPWLGNDPSEAHWTFVVDDVGPELARGYVQTALDYAIEGDDVHVLAGTFTENLVMETSRVNLWTNPGAVISGEGAGTAVTVTANRVTINGFEIAHGNPDGIALEGSDRSTIKQNEIHGNADDGVSLVDAHHNKVRKNDIHSNNAGIYLELSDNNTIRQNDVHDNNFYGIQLFDSDENVIKENSVYTNDWIGIFLLKDCDLNSIIDNEVFDTTYAGIVINAYWGDPSVAYICDGNDISGNDVYVNPYGIGLAGASGTTINGNTIHNNALGGLMLDTSDGSTIQANDIYDNGGIGVYLYLSNANSVVGNTIYDNANGIQMEDSSGNSITDNTVFGNMNVPDHAGVGILLWGDNDDNNIIGNVVYNNDRQGIFIGYSDSSKISSGNWISGNAIHNNGLNTNLNPPDPSAYGIQFMYADGNVIEGNEICGHNSWWFGQGVYLYDSYNNLVLGNYIHDNSYGMNQWGGSEGNKVHGNSIEGNGQGIWNVDVDPSSVIDAALNWWGSASGPAAATNPNGSGDAVSANVIFSPWLGIGTDAEPGTVGWQPVSPMVIVVDDVGPVPPAETVLGLIINTVAGYLNRAIGASNVYPGTDTIEVQHGTYDASEPITQAVNIVSEPGSALHTTLNGNMSINGNNVLVGLPLQGFRVNGDVAVEAGNDAGSSEIHWCDLYGTVANRGAGTYSAQYNYWGTLLESVVDARTIGSVDYQPFLPENADDSWLDANAIIDAGLATGLDPAIEQLWLMVELGMNVHRFIHYQGSAGAGAFKATPAGGQINLGGGAGGGGAISGTYTVGDMIEGAFTTTDPVTGEPITDAAVTLSLMDADGNLVYWGCATYDEETGEYVYSIDTAGMAPGTYSLIIQSDDGQSQTVMVEVEAA